MDSILLFALALIAFGGIGLIIYVVIAKAMGIRVLNPWIDQMKRGEPVVVVQTPALNMDVVLKVATRYGYELVSDTSITAPISDIGYVYDSYVFLPPQETNYTLVFRKV